jgi:hypothetical protein
MLGAGGRSLPYEIATTRAAATPRPIRYRLAAAAADQCPELTRGQGGAQQRQGFAQQGLRALSARKPDEALKLLTP